MTPPEPVFSTRYFIYQSSSSLSIIRWITITSGWFHLFFSPKPQLNSFSLLRQYSRAGFSYNSNARKILFLLIFWLSFTFINWPNDIATATALTAPTRLIIPSIALDSTVVPVGWKEVNVNGQTYGQWEVDKNLVGWHNLSAPLGQVGNSVLNGHSNLYAQVFQDLDQLKIGDSILAIANGRIYTYRVATRLLVQEKDVSVEKRLENAQLIMPTSDERLTLVTCAFAGATHRLIIVAYPTTAAGE